MAICISDRQGTVCSDASTSAETLRTRAESAVESIEITEQEVVRILEMTTTQKAAEAEAKVAEDEFAGDTPEKLQMSSEYAELMIAADEYAHGQSVPKDKFTEIDQHQPRGGVCAENKNTPSSIARFSDLSPEVKEKIRAALLKK